jgi:nucleotide-binding universal stress UspA family protein
MLQLTEVTMYQHLLIATDGSELAGKAVDQGLALAKELGAKVTAVTVTEPLASMIAGEAVYPTLIDDYDRAMELGAKRILATVREAAEKIGVTFEGVYLKEHYPADAIVEAAKARACDLIVMASHGRSGVAKLLMGSQAAKVLTYSTIAVLVCR